MDENGREVTLSERAKRILDSKELVEAMLKDKPKWLQYLDKDCPANVMLGTLAQKAMLGDKGAIELISKLAYGENINVELDKSFFNQKELKIQIVNPDATLDELKGDS